MISIVAWTSGACLPGQHGAGSATAIGGARYRRLLGAMVTLMVLGAADRADAACTGASTPTVTCGGVVVNPGQSCQNVSDIRTSGPYVVWQCNEASQRAIYSNTQSGTQGVRRLSQLAQSGQQFARLTPDNGELGRGNIYWHFGNVGSTATVYGARIDGSKVSVRMTQTANIGSDQLALSAPFPFKACSCGSTDRFRSRRNGMSAVSMASAVSSPFRDRRPPACS